MLPKKLHHSPLITPFVSAPNKFEALSAHDAIVSASGALKTLAAACFKIANDIRWSASGPSVELESYPFLQMNPGQASCLGKSTPTQSEALTISRFKSWEMTPVLVLQAHLAIFN